MLVKVTLTLLAKLEPKPSGNWSGPEDRLWRAQAAAGVQGWPSVSITRASKKCRPCLAAVAMLSRARNNIATAAKHGLNIMRVLHDAITGTPGCHQNPCAPDQPKPTTHTSTTSQPTIASPRPCPGYRERECLRSTLGKLPEPPGLRAVVRALRDDQPDVT